jgi:predicted 2-oxoglutarate/Fe(II)-dependent dioxygenase YbiX
MRKDDTTRRVRNTYGDSDPELKRVYAENTKDEFEEIDIRKVRSAIFSWLRGLVRRALSRKKA